MVWAPEVNQTESVHFVCHWAVDAIRRKPICMRACTVSVPEALYAPELSDALGQGSSHHKVQKA